MNILRIIPTMNPQKGGVAEAAAQSARLLKKENINMEILCFDKDTDEWIIKADYKVIPLGQYLTYFAINFSYITWLIKNVKNYDLVIIDGLWLFHLLGGYVCKLFKIPYVVYTHGMLDPYFNKNRLKYLKKIPSWFLIDRNILSMAKFVVYTCIEEKNISKKSFPFFKSNDFIATLGIPPCSENPEYLKSQFIKNFEDLENKNFGLYLSRIHPKKGIELLIEAAKANKILLEKNNYLIVIAGSGEETYIKSLKDLISMNNIEHLFKWVGNLSGDIKWGAFFKSDFFILPSHSENFGIVVAEALSTNTPVLITNKVNIYKEIENYNSGLVENDDLNGICNLINKFIALEDKSVLSSNAIKCYQDCFSQEAFKRDFINLISKVKNEQ